MVVTLAARAVQHRHHLQPARPAATQASVKHAYGNVNLVKVQALPTDILVRGWLLPIILTKYFKRYLFFALLCDYVSDTPTDVL